VPVTYLIYVALDKHIQKHISGNFACKKLPNIKKIIPVCSENSVSREDGSCPDRQHPTQWSRCSCIQQFLH